MASDENDFARRAARLASVHAGLRPGLRERMAASPLCDAEAFAADWLALVQA